MESFLIAGLPGSGKSTVLNELRIQGYSVLDADTDKSLSQWKHRHTNSWVRHRDTSMEDWNEHYDWSWKEERLREILADTDKNKLFIGGNAANIKDFYKLFKRVFALVLDDSTLEHRLHNRGNGYGSTPEELHSILEWNKDFSEVELQRGATVIDGGPSPQAIASTILEIINDNQ